MFDEISLPIALTYGTLALTILSLWFPIKTIKPLGVSWVTLLLMAGALALGFHYQFLLLNALFALLAFLVLCLAFRFAAPGSFVRVILWVAIIALALGFILHMVPWFRNPFAFVKTQFSADSLHYSLYLNFDKAWVGICILAFCHERIISKSAWGNTFKHVVIALPFVVGGLLGLSYYLGYVKYDLKFSPLFIIWALNNLVIVCVAEEALFRGFIQKNMAHYFGKAKSGKWVALLLTATGFGALHYAGGQEYMLLSGLAALGYGGVYMMNNRIEASILLHFLVNLVHIVFFSYPALIR